MNHKLDHKLKKVAVDDHVGTLHEYDVDLQSNHIYLMGMESYVTGTTKSEGEPGIEYTIANRFIRNLNLCMRRNPDQAILIHMKTCGGDTIEGMAIYDAIKSCPFPVTILNYTHARSMSSYIFQAANKRVMMPHSYFMIHEGTMQAGGTVKQTHSYVEFEKRHSNKLNQIYIDVLLRKGTFTNAKDAARWLRAQQDKKEDVYWFAEEAVELGFADSVFDYNWSSLTEYTEEEIQRG